jgi:putative heme-binding domain-containing protein
VGRLLESIPRASGALAALLARARERAADSDARLEPRLEALETLSLDRFERAAPILLAAIDARQPPEVQRAAARTLGRFQADGVAELLLGMWPELGGEARPHVIEVLFASPRRLERLIAALEQERFPPADLDSVRVQQLFEHPRADLRERARRVLAERVLQPRPEVVEAYRGALASPGNPARGRALFEHDCAPCHRADGVGHAAGPDLAAAAQAGPETILVNVLDPNREVDPRYRSVAVETRDRTVTGILASETAASLTLRRAGGGEDTILKRDVESVRLSQLSLMPEGWEQGWSAGDLADLIGVVSGLGRAEEGP